MFEQIKLDYAYDALEPYIDALTVETHYSKHHATYTKTLNELAQKCGVENMEITTLLSSLDKIEDEALRKGIRNNGGGFFNHNLYFSTIAPNAGGKPDGILAKKIDETFGSFEAFQEKLTNAALTQFGSGWAWLCKDNEGSLVITQSSNQDNPYSLKENLKPILVIDVWEHAYYLKYKNLRASYVKEFFNVINWKKVEELYLG